LIESAVHDFVEGIPAFWADKSIARVGGQIFKAFLMVCTFALIAIYDQWSSTSTVIAKFTVVVADAPPKSKERSKSQISGANL